MTISFNSKFYISALVLLMASSAFVIGEWGFYGHRKINRMAVFTLPPEMMPVFKKNIEFLTEHSVDPDKRRYATKHEAVRHYIDIDMWDVYPFDNVPRNFTDALLRYAGYYKVSGRDTTLLDLNLAGDGYELYDENHSISGKYSDFRMVIGDVVRENYFEEEWIVDMGDLIEEDTEDETYLIIKDEFSHGGILPYWLMQMQTKLKNAFMNKDKKRILRLSAEMGHYIGDAHVPLHTTKNYNGQLTDQIGIHAFWESRIPELFADEDYDFFVGKSTYIDNKSDYFWDIVLDSHILLDSVLSIEKRLSKTFPSDLQYCYDERLDQTIRVQCPEYADAYSTEMKGMVEDRMRDAILSIGSSWFTAWVDAGQPDLSDLGEHELTDEEKKKQEMEDEAYKSGEIKGREHGK